MDSVLNQFTMLAVTDVLASLMMLTHYSTRISYGTKDNLEDMLNSRFDNDNNDSSLLIPGPGMSSTWVIVLLIHRVFPFIYFSELHGTEFV